ncbi:class I SAM-dependent methyltransferase [Rhizobium rhizogenes]|uniref:class I SAM-dependent methyltransferase n=1 Tax=Rhizobium rhizogenes TaxID=359 RepID=UPI000B1D4D54|nr:50S ribosomal protein L11 methyltransferase [Rhizobium rhizogenes]MDJ1635724.1 50S ribosomal protein L11 methyltransferase [Rhizobium rhizogenes]
MTKKQDGPQPNQDLSHIRTIPLREGEPIDSGDKPEEVAQAVATIDAVRTFIAAHLPVLPVPSIPEIRLHKAGPQSGLRLLAERDEAFGSPYWAHYWGGGLVLARYILDRPDVVAGRRVLDLGAGSGIVGIAAAKAGAIKVIAADVDPYAIAAIELNAALNRVAILPVLADLTTGEPPATDIVCVGDLFYEAVLAERVTIFLDRCLERGIDILIGDPWRAHLPHSRLRLLAEYAVTDFGDTAGSSKPSGVFAFQKKPPRHDQDDRGLP